MHAYITLHTFLHKGEVRGKRVSFHLFQTNKRVTRSKQQSILLSSRPKLYKGHDKHAHYKVKSRLVEQNVKVNVRGSSSCQLEINLHNSTVLTGTCSCIRGNSTASGLPIMCTPLGNV